MLAMVVKPQPPAWAQAIRSRRESLGALRSERVTQEDIAARSGDLLSQRTVSHLEQGSIELNSLAYGRVVALAKALEWTLPELQAATGLGTDTSVASPRVELEIPKSLREAIEKFGDQYPDLRDERWQRFLSKTRWRSGQPSKPDRWIEAYRDLVRNDIEPF